MLICVLVSRALSRRVQEPHYADWAAAPLAYDG
jgi:hypothetical protein